MGDYPKIKFIESILFSQDMKEKLNDIVLDIRFLICLDKYLDSKLTGKYVGTYIDNNIKEKIYYIVKQIRNNINNNKQTPEEIELLNTIITKTNKMKQGDILDYYYNQAIKRAHDTEKTSHDYKMTRILDMFEAIRESISYDYEVLSDLYKAKEQSGIIEKYKGNGWFLSSVKGMYAECSEMFDEKPIKENLKSVVDENEKVLTKERQNLRYSNSEIRRQILER